MFGPGRDGSPSSQQVAKNDFHSCRWVSSGPTPWCSGAESHELRGCEVRAGVAAARERPGGDLRHGVDRAVDDRASTREPAAGRRARRACSPRGRRRTGDARSRRRSGPARALARRRPPLRARRCASRARRSARARPRGPCRAATRSTSACASVPRARGRSSAVRVARPPRLAPGGVEVAGELFDPRLEARELRIGNDRRRLGLRQRRRHRNDFDGRHRLDRRHGHRFRRPQLLRRHGGDRRRGRRRKSRGGRRETDGVAVLGLRRPAGLGRERLGDRRRVRETEPNDDDADRLAGALALGERVRELLLRDQAALHEDLAERSPVFGRRRQRQAPLSIVLIKKSFAADLRVARYSSVIVSSGQFAVPRTGDCTSS